MKDHSQGIIVLEAESLEELDTLLSSFEDKMSKWKDIMKDKFNYDIDINYDVLSITINMKVEDDNTEGSSYLN